MAGCRKTLCCGDPVAKNGPSMLAAVASPQVGSNTWGLVPSAWSQRSTRSDSSLHESDIVATPLAPRMRNSLRVQPESLFLGFIKIRSYATH
jgi:hypothetical protein